MVSARISYQCSNCEKDMFPFYQYCPNCGAPAHWEQVNQRPEAVNREIFELDFFVAKCVKNENKIDAFKVGEYYPVMGYNNGVQIVGSHPGYGGDAVVVSCYSEDVERPWDEEKFGGLEFENGFKAYVYKPKNDDLLLMRDKHFLDEKERIRLIKECYDHENGLSEPMKENQDKPPFEEQ